MSDERSAALWLGRAWEAPLLAAFALARAARNSSSSVAEMGVPSASVIGLDAEPDADDTAPVAGKGGVSPEPGVGAVTPGGPPVPAASPALAGLTGAGVLVLPGAGVAAAEAAAAATREARPRGRENHFGVVSVKSRWKALRYVS